MWDHQQLVIVYRMNIESVNKYNTKANQNLIDTLKILTRWCTPFNIRYPYNIYLPPKRNLWYATHFMQISRIHATVTSQLMLAYFIIIWKRHTRKCCSLYAKLLILLFLLPILLQRRYLQNFEHELPITRTNLHNETQCNVTIKA